jgi:hypothetical protein
MNPFYMIPHTPSPYFCDRERETEDLVSYLTNGANVTLISPRRYGKTGLIYHVFDTVKERGLDYETYYVDIFATRSPDDFIAMLTEAISRELKAQTQVKRFFETLGRIRPVISQDPLSGAPKVSFTFQSDMERRYSLKALFDFLEHRPRKVIVAIDEFQQIREYAGMSMEALLRTYIQPLTNVRFIFSGSRKRMMAEMFTAENSPFYESASLYSIDKIDRAKYAEFIDRLFRKQGKNISEEAVDYILEWTRCHTFYTQFLCNRVFQAVEKTAALMDVLVEADKILNENNDVFLERRNFLTPKQWDYLIAVAKEGTVYSPTGSEFLQRYHLGAPSTAARLLSSLTEKELLLENRSASGLSCCVYNVFFSRWLERM